MDDTEEPEVCMAPAIKNNIASAQSSEEEEELLSDDSSNEASNFFNLLDFLPFPMFTKLHLCLRLEANAYMKTFKPKRCVHSGGTICKHMPFFFPKHVLSPVLLHFCNALQELVNNKVHFCSALKTCTSAVHWMSCCL